MTTQTTPKPRKRAAYFRDYRRKKREAKTTKGGETAERAGRYAPTLHGWRDWCAGELVIPSGPLQGEPFTIEDWEFEFLLDAEGKRESGLSCARKNGKSGLIAALFLGYLAGPLNFPDFRGVVASLTGELAKELRGAIRLTAEQSGLVGVEDRATPVPGLVLGLRGAVCKFLASDKSTGHAIGSDLAVIDEAGLLDESKRGLWNALLSSTSGRNGRLLCISIQGTSPMFAELRERADDDAVAWHEYSAPRSLKIDDPAAWSMANPGLKRGIKSILYMRDMSRRALLSPADQPDFRAFDLNQPQQPGREPLCSLSDWLACVRPPDELPERRGPCVVAYDLGGSSSMCALVALWPLTGRAEAWGAFPALPDLAERGQADGVGGLYLRMYDRGELATYPGRVTPVGEFLKDCAARLEGEGVLVAGADRYRRAEAFQAMQEAALGWPMEFRGQGANAGADGSHDVRAFQRAILRGTWAMEESLLFESGITESSIRRDGAGNPALERSRSRGRIDVLQAAVIAAGLAELSTGPVEDAVRVAVA